MKRGSKSPRNAIGRRHETTKICREVEKDGHRKASDYIRDTLRFVEYAETVPTCYHGHVISDFDDEGE